MARETRALPGGRQRGLGGLMDQKRAALVFLVTGEHSGPLRGSDL